MIAIGAGIAAGRGNRYLRIRYRYPDHSVHGITIRSRKRHKQADSYKEIRKRNVRKDESTC